MYAKLSDNTLRIAPKQVQREGHTVINPSEDILLALGYLPVQYTDPPAVDDGFYAAPRWTQTETAIMQQWDVVKDTRPLTAEEVTAMLIRQKINTLEVDDTTALRMREFYPDWAAGQDYTVGFKVQRGGVLYKVLQAHTSQDGWEPESAQSLWAKVLIPDETVVPEWEQPDSTNPYSAGDKVAHNGKTWVSNIDSNVWEPGVYGWTEVST